MKHPSAIMNRVWFRTALVVTASTLAIAGIAQAVTTLSADLNTDGDLTADGSITLGTVNTSVLTLAGTSMTVNIDTGNIDIDTGEGIIDIAAGGGNLLLSAASDGYNSVLIAGDEAPDALEDGNDIALEAEDAVHIQSGGSFNVNAVAGGSNYFVDTNLNMRSYRGSIYLEAVDSPNNGDDMIVFSAGNAPPDALAGGNDIGLEAEDAILLRSTGATSITSTGALNLSSTTTNVTISADSGVESIILDGRVDVQDSIQVGSGGSIFDGIKGASGTAGNGGVAIGANACIEDTITATGVETGDPLIVNAPFNIEADLVWSAYTSTTNSVKVRICNPTTGGITSADKTWTVTWFSLAP